MSTITTDKKRWPLEQARAVAAEIVELMRDACVRIEVAVRWNLRCDKEGAR